MICFSLPSWLQLFQAHFSLPCQAFQGWGAGRAKSFTLHRQASPAAVHAGSQPAPTTASACPESRRSVQRGTDLHLLEEPLRDPACHPVRENDWAYFSFSHHSASPVRTQHLFTVTVPTPTHPPPLSHFRVSSSRGGGPGATLKEPTGLTSHLPRWRPSHLGRVCGMSVEGPIHGLS